MGALLLAPQPVPSFSAPPQYAWLQSRQIGRGSTCFSECVSDTLRGRLPLCRVTNSEEEMYDPDLPFAYSADMVNLGPQYQIPNPELGPLERRVEKTFVEAIFSDEISLEDTNYWFTEPDGGWNSEDVWAHNLREEQPSAISAAHFGQGRTDLSELRDGTVLKGTVVSILLYHGIQVDIGAQFDGLIPVRQDEWQMSRWRVKYGICTGVANDFEIGQEVTVQVHRVNHRSRCRWPVQLTVLEPDVQHKLIHPDAWSVPFDLRGVRSYEEAFSITGRPMPQRQPPELVFADEDLIAMQQQYQSKRSTAELYGVEPDALDGMRAGSNIVERISRRGAETDASGGAAALATDVAEDDDAYDESVVPV